MLGINEARLSFTSRISSIKAVWYTNYIIGYASIPINLNFSILTHSRGFSFLTFLCTFFHEDLLSKRDRVRPPPFFTRVRDIIWGRIRRRVGFNLRAFHLTIPLSLSPLYPSISLSLPLFPSLYPSLSLSPSLPPSLSLISPSLSISFLLPFFLSLSFSLSSLYHSLWRI